MPEFELGNDKEYEVEAIQDSTIYAKKVDGHLSRLYYLIAWKGYLKKKHLGTFLSHHVPPEDDQHLPQRPSEEANSNISTSELRFAHG